jgi:hypothetical protein
MFLFGAAAIAVGIVAYAVMRSPSAPSADEPVAGTSRPVGALTMRDTKELQAKQREWAERIKQPEVASTKSDVFPASPPTAHQSADNHVEAKPANGSAEPADVTAATADDRHTATTDKQRMVEKLTRPRAKVADKVEGATMARETVLAARCRAPDAQQKYRELAGAERLKMRATCAKYGVQLTE